VHRPGSFRSSAEVDRKPTAGFHTGIRLFRAAEKPGHAARTASADTVPPADSCLEPRPYLFHGYAAWPDDASPTVTVTFNKFTEYETRSR